MTILCLLFSFGIVVAGYLPQLPAPFLLIALLGFSCVLTALLRKKYRGIYALLAFLLGLSYGVFSGDKFISSQLAGVLVAQDIIVEGQVIDLPQADDRR